ncbi:hypothetical protein ACFWWT_35865 [Streptomyces sp. NPDC058676]|uniref:hypothetical protein n=1 Tax=unclassified Streptomyces TaxID=2593676 RepID=UPI00365418C8
MDPVKAFGVNASKVTTGNGLADSDVALSRIPGIEGVGVVDEALEGAGVTPAAMIGGMGRSFDGFYAQQAEALEVLGRIEDSLTRAAAQHD